MIKIFYKNWRVGIVEFQDYIFEEIKVIREKIHKYCYIEFSNYPATMRIFVPAPNEYKSLQPVRDLTPEQKAEQEKAEQELIAKFNSSYVKVKDLEIPYDAFNIDFTRFPDYEDWKAYREHRSEWYPNLRDFCTFTLFNAPTYGWHVNNYGKHFHGCRIDVLQFALNKWLHRGEAIGLKADFDDRGNLILSKGHFNDENGNPIYAKKKEYTNEEINANIDKHLQEQVDKGYITIINDVK